MNVKIRKGAINDIKIIEEFQDNLVKFERHFDDRIKKDKVSYYDIRALINSKNAYFIVCELDRKIIGCGFGEIRKEPAWAKNSTFGYVGLMFLNEKFRGIGIGNKILKEIVGWLKRKNITEIRLKVYEENLSAVNFYKKFGFKNFVLEMKLK